MATANGSAPAMAAQVVIMMGLKRSEQACAMACKGSIPKVRSACSAKSTIMMAFFLTIPISKRIPRVAIKLNSVPVAIKASRAPSPAEGSVESMVSGCE